MKAKVAAIAAHGVTCFVNRQLIYNYPENLLAEYGIMSIEHADFEGVERLALVTGGDITSTFDAPDKVKIGRCEVIEEIMIGEDKVCSASYKVLDKADSAVDQILWCRCRRSMYGRFTRWNYPDGRGGREVITRCPLRSIADSQGDQGYSRWWLRRDGNVQQGR